MKPGKASHTAGTVAQSLLVTSHDRVFGRLVPAEAIGPTRAMLVAARGGWVRLLDRAWMRGLARLWERAILPGVFLHHTARKAWIERRVRARLEEGAGQVIAIGAGYDTLAMRLSRVFPNAVFWEFDHPATQRVKLLATAAGRQAATNLHLVPVDLTAAGPEDMLGSLEGLDPGLPVIYIMEGVLMYLDEREIGALLDAVGRFGGPGSLLVGTQLRPDGSGAPSMGSSRWAIDRLLSMSSEPFRSAIEPAALGAMLQRRGFMAAFTSVAEALPELLPGLREIPPLPPGEYLFSARS